MKKKEIDSWGKIQCWSGILGYGLEYVKSYRLKDYSEFKLAPKEPMKIYYDNKVAIGISHRPVQIIVLNMLWWIDTSLKKKLRMGRFSCLL